MDRRDFLRATLLAGASTLLPAPVLAGFQNGRNFGWSPNAEAMKRFIATHDHPFLSQLNSRIRGTGEGKTVLLWKALEQIMGTPYEPHNQGIGDCVGQGYALGVDILTAVQAVVHGKPEKWVAKASSEILYAGGRIEVGGLSGRNARGDGSTGYWQAEFITSYGVLLRQKYPGGHDFTTYDAAKARQLGRTGVPDELEPLCKLHPVKTAAIVKSWEECRDSVANGHPVAMCSNIGFGDSSREWVRDSQGFLTRKRKPWWHCMLVAAIDDNPRRPGGLVFNSWGPNWVTGPTRLDQPRGTFWVDADTLDTAMKQGDSMALSNYVGYPGLSVPDYVIWQPRP